MADLSGELRLRNGAVEWFEQDGETVLFDLKRAWYLGLNGSATRLWTELAHGATRDELTQILQSEYGLTHDRAAADVDGFLAECAERGLLD